ncbi:MAG: type II toxin-antitoxin system VapC family toxin [Nitrospirota bacterium]
MGKEAACIDTDICIDFLRNREPGFGMFLKGVSEHIPYITSITAFELHLGHIKMKKKESLDNFINRFHILTFDSLAAKTAAKIQAELDEKGTDIGMPDTLIAGICIANSIPLLTNNVKHFSRIKALKLIE